MAFEPAPFDVVEASRRVWLERWNDEAASGMAVFTAILRSQQLLSNEIATVMRQHDLTFARYEVLSWLAIDPESSQTLSWISKTLRIPPATVTNLIDRLQDDKLVRRVQHPDDARTTLAVITPRGKRLADAATQDLNTTVYERIGLTDRQRDAAHRPARRAAGQRQRIRDRSLATRHRRPRVPTRPRRTQAMTDTNETHSSGTDDLWEAMSTARSIRRFTDEPVDDDVLRRCFEAATWAPSGANFQAWRFVILRSPEQRAVVAAAAAHALAVIEPVYRMTRPDPDDDSKRARSNRATYELHDRAGEFTSVLFATRRFTSASELLLGGSIYPAVAELPAGRPRHRARRLSDELGRLRGRGDAARRGRRARHVDAGIACRRRLAARSARSAPPPPDLGRRRPRPLRLTRLGRRAALGPPRHLTPIASDHTVKA